MDKMLGRICGVLSTKKLPVRGATFYDLTAGDGRPWLPTSTTLLPVTNDEAFDKHCSPGIYLRHCHWASTRLTHAPVRLLMVEKQAATHAVLLQTVGRWLTERNWRDVGGGCFERNGCAVQVLHSDARYLAPQGRAKDQAAHIYCDPNNIEDWALTGDFLEACPSFTTSITTLGCNPSGLKRIPLERRAMWYQRIGELTDYIVRGWHDACLFSVGGPDQWAYLITAPTVWRDDVTEYCLKAATKIEGREAVPSVVWLKNDPDEFRRLQDYLFLTRKEREVVA